MPFDSDLPSEVVGTLAPKLPDIRAQLMACFPSCSESLVGLFLEFLLRSPAEVCRQAMTVLPKPYGRNHILLVNAGFGLSLAQIEPEQSTSLHFHSSRREFFCVMTGELSLVVGDKESTLGVGECGMSTPNVPHSLRNKHSSTLRVLEMFSPALLEDKVRVSDKYERPLGAVSLHQ